MWEEIGNQNRFFQCRKRLLEFANCRAPINGFSVIAVSIDCKEHFWFYLFEAIDHAARTKVRGTARPDRAEAGRRQKSDSRFWNIRHIRYNPVAALHPHIA